MNYLTVICISMLVCLAASADNSSLSGGIKCYVCNELIERACGEPFVPGDLNRGVVTCGSEYKYCRKTIQVVGDKKSIVRQCGEAPYKDGSEGCYKTAGKSTQHVCTCIGKSTEPCNTSFKMQSSLLVIISSIIFKLLF